MTAVDFLQARAPQGVRLYAIGDVHGRFDLLSAMHERIAADVERDKPFDWRVIHLGDYIDRGPDSRRVLDFLIAAKQRDDRAITLTGNHELGLLDFLANPDPDALFVRYGGVETARSYGVELLRDGSVAQGHRDLLAALPRSHLEFIRSLAFSFEAGDFFFCHAGVRPGIALAQQSNRDLTWIRDEFLNDGSLHGKIVVHGHTPVQQPDVRRNRVNLDTYACGSGRLTALRVDGAVKQILTVSDDGRFQRRDAVTP
ncbi:MULTISPECIES: metallophosphoesterase family protein [unclassified Mesorhizobium]|uniref:metallophosphoesterase family protein n=1 Tax=unclassified Mesorhizobium TaxID=325217 RepID=UPI000AD96BB7|nr:MULTISPECIES: metallophosphoesterase family protein [unclassified Mesorhizobium]MDR7033047.1 serine/threonine protein phosphatase 1 [Mesorhizobium sp. BE184]